MNIILTDPRFPGWLCESCKKVTEQVALKKKEKKKKECISSYLIFLAESYQVRVSDWQGGREKLNQPQREFSTKCNDAITYGSLE